MRRAGFNTRPRDATTAPAGCDRRQDSRSEQSSRANTSEPGRSSRRERQDTSTRPGVRRVLPASATVSAAPSPRLNLASPRQPSPCGANVVSWMEYDRCHRRPNRGEAPQFTGPPEGVKPRGRSPGSACLDFPVRLVIMPGSRQRFPPEPVNDPEASPPCPIPNPPRSA